MKIWDFLIKMIVIYSCFTVMFWCSFHDYSVVWIIVIDYIFEFMLLIDMLSRFLRIYRENEKKIWNLQKIGHRYIVVKKTFFLDFIPLVFTIVHAASQVRLLLLFRMFWFVRLWRFIDKFSDETVRDLL